MTPIVNRLEEDFESVTFVALNARDGDAGERAFADLNLPGHPSFVLFDSLGVEQFRAVGVVEETILRDALSDR